MIDSHESRGAGFAAESRQMCVVRNETRRNEQCCLDTAASERFERIGGAGEVIAVIG